MKKYAALLLAALAAFGLTACASNTANAEIDYGTSDLYSKADMDAAIALVIEEFSSWEGCELHSIRYSSDECNNNENLEWLNMIAQANGKNITFTQCMKLVSDFHSPLTNSGAWEEDCEYTNWGWWFARAEGGERDLLTWGYGR